MEKRQRYYVEAKTISKEKIEFDCPFCFTRYKKDGLKPTKKAKHLTHVHSNLTGFIDNQMITRVPSCGNRFPFDQFSEFEIGVTDSTHRFGTGTSSKRIHKRSARL